MKGKDIKVGATYYCNPSTGGYSYRDFVAKPVGKPGEYFQTNRSNWSYKPSVITKVKGAGHVSDSDMRYANMHVLCHVRQDYATEWESKKKLVPLRQIVRTLAEHKRIEKNAEATQKKYEKEREARKKINKKRLVKIIKAVKAKDGDAKIDSWDSKHLEDMSPTLCLDLDTLEKVLGLPVHSFKEDEDDE